MRYTRPAKHIPQPDIPEKPPIQTWRYGWHIRPGSLWIGAHWSAANKRLCINLLPCVTVWVVMPGGFAP
ncbi:hypothetical protein [Methylomonas rapida]|uniref:Uncharacterized protein n=1 Tax=Methylomonas rapida TaxID=2963939 RepID=A0ABY7GGK5_9GAMM|nr:hypothetical protein [Methylomonas rapida]WAR43626.1 hypothetical protein NM686_014730 [Methylomonas rapida]WAR45500.1 hypothetical protein NM686_003015 [Methylomonas rapida]